MSSFLVALRKEWMELVRTHRLLVVGVVMVAFGLLSPLAAKFTPELIRLIPEGEAIAQIIPPPTMQDAVIQYVKNMSQFGILLAVLLSMGALAQEKERGTAALLLVKPLPRGAFLAAKFAALAGMFAACLAGAGIAAYYYTLLLFEAMPMLPWLALNGLLLAYLLVYVALTLLASTLTRSQAAAGGLALGMLILLGLVGSLPRLGEHLPGALTAWGARLMAGDPTASWSALWVSLGLILAALLAAWLVFRRQEL